jgi:hypothetical protein
MKKLRPGIGDITATGTYAPDWSTKAIGMAAAAFPNSEPAKGTTAFADAKP